MNVDLMSRLAEIEHRPSTPPVDRYNVWLAQVEITRLCRENDELREQVKRFELQPPGQ
jgi:hypothetical protein